MCFRVRNSLRPHTFIPKTCARRFGLLHRIPPQPAKRRPGEILFELQEDAEERGEQEDLFVPADHPSDYAPTHSAPLHQPLNWRRDSESTRLSLESGARAHSSHHPAADYHFSRHEEYDAYGHDHRDESLNDEEQFGVADQTPLYQRAFMHPYPASSILNGNLTLVMKNRLLNTMLQGTSRQVISPFERRVSRPATNNMSQGRTGNSYEAEGEPHDIPITADMNSDSSLASVD